MQTRVNFIKNAPSVTYFDGFVIHKVNPLQTCKTTATQTTGVSRLSDVSGIVRKNPSSRSPKMKMKPMTIAVPHACTVSANGHPHNDSPLAHSENAEFSRYSSTVHPPSIVRPTRSCASGQTGPQPCSGDTVQRPQRRAQRH